MIYINLIVITFIVCFIIDYSGIVEELESKLASWYNVPNGFIKIPKPFSCSLCSSFWLGLIYLLCIGEFSIINMGFVCLMAALSGSVTDTIYLIRDIYNKLLVCISSILNK